MKETMNRALPTGKLPADLLAALLARVPRDDPRVIVGPNIGQDAAVIEMGDHYLVAKTDPITFATDDIGWYAVNVGGSQFAYHQPQSGRFPHPFRLQSF